DSTFLFGPVYRLVLNLIGPINQSSHVSRTLVISSNLDGIQRASCKFEVVQSVMVPSPVDSTVDALANEHGLNKLCFTGFVHSLMDPCMAEAFAIREALSWLCLHVDQVLLESDSLVTISALNHPRVDVSNFGLLIYDCSHLQFQFQQ
ncbi:hypothetical protein Gogos_021312, partial [Gossypium gossypioides]|nr:hypothetical protein [Gossypium gossypioides]